MPTVNRVDIPRVQQRGLGVRPESASTEAFDTAQRAAQTLQQSGQTLGNIAVDKRNRDDAAAVKGKISELRQAINNRAYIDEDAYYKRKGRDAFDTYGDMNDELLEISKQYSADLKPGRQQDLYSKAAQEYLNQESVSMSKYAANEERVWWNSEDEASISLDQQDGSLRWIDNSQYSQKIDTTADTLAQRNGWGDKKTEAYKLQAKTKMHVAAIDNILRDAPGAADNYFEAHKDNIAPSLHDEIQDKIKKRNDAEWALGKADEIALSGGSRSEKMEMVKDATDDPYQRDLLKKQVAYEIDQQEKAEREMSIDTYNLAAEEIRNTGQSAIVWAETNPDQWNTMNEQQKRNLINGGRASFDPVLYNEILGEIDLGNKANALKMIADNTHALGGYSKGLVDKINAQPPETPNAISDRSAFDDKISEVIGPKPASSKRTSNAAWNKKRNIVYGYYQQELDAWKEETGRKYIDNTSRQRILDDIAIKFVKERAFWFDEEITLKDIPAQDMADIEQMLQDNNRPVTPENIIKLYMAK